MARVARLTAEQMRRSRPVRNPGVQESRDGDTITLSGPAPLKGLLGKMLQRAAAGPVVKQYELEEVGSFVWTSIDGKRSFESLSRQVQRRLKLNRAEADASLDAFLRMLADRGLITMLVKQ